MRFRTGRAVAAGAAVAITVAGVSVAAAPPISSSGRGAQRAARADLKDPTRKTIPQASQARPVAAATTRARAQLRDSLGRYAQLTVNQQTGGLQAVARLDGYLTGRSSASATSIALGYVRAHAAAFGLTQQDLDGLKLVRDYTSSADGVRHLQWAQVVDGVTVADSSLLANVASDGRLVNVLGGARGGTLNRRSPAVSADAAYGRTLRSVGSRAAVPQQKSARSTGARTTTYKGSGRAELVAYHAGSGLRLAWRVLAPVSADGTYDSLVDAADGRLARRANLVKFADALVFDAAPGDHPGGTQTRKPIGQWLDAGADHLEGPNAHAFADVRDEVGPLITEDDFQDRFTPPADGDVPPSAGSDWLYPIQSVPDATGECPPDPPGCTWNHTVPDSWQLNRNEATTQLFYYVNKFHDHLLGAPIGFDRASGNFEGTDKVFAQSDDGADTAGGLPDDAHQDNANFDTRPDGIPGLMQMYLFEPIPIAPGVQIPFASVNGSDDPQIVYHEYTHGLSNRLITDAQGYAATAGIQSGAMGEAWSDWYALDFLARQGFQRDDPAPGDVKEGEYVDNGQNLIRTEPTDCPPDAPGIAACPGFAETGPGGYTYQDFGLIVLGAPGGARLPEPHSDGEIWAQTLWQLRQRLVARYGQVGGSNRAEGYITGGMRMGPPQPSFLDQRNAILQESALAGGADTSLIWEVFASRGMGYFASTRGDFDYEPDADFSVPPTGSATGIVRGVVRDDNGAPVGGALVGLGGHDGPPNAGPALQATTAADGSYKITGIPQAEYPQITVEAPAGYADASGGRVAVGSSVVTRDLTVRRNYADNRAGGSITSDARNDAAWGCGWDKAIDGSQDSAVETASPDFDGDGEDLVNRTFTVTLSQPVNGAEVFIDPQANCYNLADSSLSAYVLQVSTDGTTFTTVATGTFDRHSNGHLNRVAVANQKMPNGVRKVRLIARATQGMLGGPIGDNGALAFSELQVYARPNGPSATEPGGGGGGGGGAAAAQLRPGLNRAKGRQRVKNKRVRYKVRCVRATAGTLPARCRMTLTLGSLGKKTVTLKPRKYTTVTFKLKARDLKRLNRKRSIRTKLKASVRNPGATTRRASRTVRILRAAKKRR
jgi:extracellular elastinolytic metalloproteinase